MAKKAEMVFVNNTYAIAEKIKEKPLKVLQIIGKSLVDEIKADGKIPKKTGRLKKSLGHGVYRNEGSLQIGFKQFYAPFVLGQNDPITPVVKRNSENIKDLIAKALDEIRKEKT